MASWRALGSILEAPGLDFGGLRDAFSIFSYVFEHLCRELAEHLPRTCRVTQRLPSIAKVAILLKTRDNRPRSSKGGGAAVVPPLGAFN